MSTNDWNKGEMTDFDQTEPKNGANAWKTIPNKGQKGPKGSNGATGYARGSNGAPGYARGFNGATGYARGSNGAPGYARGSNGNKSQYGGATRKKPSQPSVNNAVKVHARSELRKFIEEKNALPSELELDPMIALIFEAIRTPTQKVSREEYQYLKGLKFENLIGMIRATILNSIIPEMMHFGVAHPDFDIELYSVETLAPFIQLVEQDSSKSADGFHFVNRLFWDNRMELLIKDGLMSGDDLAELYIQKQIEVINAIKKIGVSREALNKKSEDWLLSYFEGVKARCTLFDKRVVETLSNDLKTDTLVRELINKISPQMSPKMVRKFKYLVLMDMTGLSRGLLLNILASYVFGKKFGVHERVTSFLEMAITFLKVNKNEFDDKTDVLCFWLKETYVCNDDKIREFLLTLSNQAMLLLTEQDSHSHALLSNSVQWAWDAIGSLIGEISVILNDPNIFRTFFESQRHAVTPESNAEKQMITLVAHTILRLKKIPLQTTAQKCEALGTYLTTSICFDISRFEFSLRSRMLIEDQISKFLDTPKTTRSKIRNISLSDVGDVLHSNRMAEYLKLHDTQDITADVTKDITADVTKDITADVTEDDDDTEANDRITEVIDCNYSRDINLSLLPEALDDPGTTYMDFVGWHDVCNAMAKGIMSWKPISSVDDHTLYLMIGNIAYYVAAELHPAPEKATMRSDQISALIKVLQAHVKRSKLQKALTDFNEDLHKLSDETLNYLWDNMRGKNNFSDFCHALDVESSFD
jgi:hypothetical protein